MSAIPAKEVDPKTDSVSARESHERTAPKSRGFFKFTKADTTWVTVDDGDSAASSLTDLETLNRVPKGSVFDDADAAQFYKPIENYEGRHRFDPDATWTEEEETRLVRRVDLKICAWACIMFFALQLDRGNLSQALSDNFLKDLKLTTNNYNNGQTIFYCSFLFAEMPSQFIGKKVGPDVWLPLQMIAWSTVAASQSRLTGVNSFYICRFLLGILEGGFIPDMILYLSYFYKNRELPARLAWFWTAYVATQIVASFLAFGILHLRGHGSLVDGWRYLFAIEGAITAIIGIISFLYLPPSPTQTKRTGIKGILRSKHGWFTEREEVIMVTRILRDDPGKATMHNRQAVTWKLFWAALKDYDLWPIYLIGLSWGLPMTPSTNYLTLTLKNLGFSTFRTNLLVIPSSVLFILQLQFWTWLSEKLNQRFLIVLMSQVWALPLLIALEVLPPAQWSRYVLLTLLVGYPYVHAILVAGTSRNAGTVRTRTIGSSLYNMSVQASNIFATQVYQAKDKPYYYTGNKALLGVVAFNFVIIIATKIYYDRRNKQRDQIWKSMTREERINYLATTKDEGNKRLDFRFAS